MFCDIVEPSIVNDKTLPLLRIFALDTISPMFHNEMFPIMLWKKVVSGTTSKIRVWVTVGDKPISIMGDMHVVLQIK